MGNLPVKEKKKNVKEKAVELAVVEDASVASEGESVEGTKHEEIRKLAISLKDQEASLFWELAVTLSEIQGDSLYIDWGYNTWGEYVDEELEISMRAVQKYLRVYKWFKDMPENIQSWIKSLGWTKAQHLVRVVTPENAGQWRDRIAGLTVAQIEAMIDEYKNGKTSEAGDGSAGSGGDSEAEAVERPKALKLNLMPAQFENVNIALEKAAEMTESDRDNNNIDLICTDWLANSVGMSSMADRFRSIERSSNVLIIAYRKDPDRDDYDVVYGDQNFEIIEADPANADDEESDAK